MVEHTQCPRCKRVVDANLTFCPYCGYQLKLTPSQYPIGEKVFETAQPAGSRLTAALKVLLGTNPPITNPNLEVYAKRPPYTSIRKYLLFGIVMFVVGMSLVYGGMWLAALGLTIMGFAAPTFLLIWIYRNDRFETEPVPLVVFIFGWGVIIGVLALILNSFLVGPLMAGLTGNAALSGALVEEPLKAYGVYWLAKHPKLGKEFNDQLDGLVYGAAAGAAFAGMENLGYIVRNIAYLGLAIIIVRSLTPIMHIFTTGFIGRWLGIQKVKRGFVKKSDFVTGLVIAIVIHGFWNSGIFGLFVVSLVIPFLYLIHKCVRKSLKDEIIWGFSKGYVPTE